MWSDAEVPPPAGATAMSQSAVPPGSELPAAGLLHTLAHSQGCATPGVDARTSTPPSESEGDAARLAMPAGAAAMSPSAMPPESELPAAGPPHALAHSQGCGPRGAVAHTSSLGPSHAMPPAVLATMQGPTPEHQTSARARRMRAAAASKGARSCRTRRGAGAAITDAVRSLLKGPEAHLAASATPGNPASGGAPSGSLAVGSSPGDPAGQVASASGRSASSQVAAMAARPARPVGPKRKAGRKAASASGAGVSGLANSQAAGMPMSPVLPTRPPGPNAAGKKSLANSQAAGLAALPARPPDPNVASRSVLTSSLADSQAAGMGMPPAPAGSKAGQAAPKLPALTADQGEDGWKTTWGVERAPIMLGSGAFGSVSLAMCRATGRLAAKKRVAKSDDAELFFAQYFYKHPHKNLLKAIAYIDQPAARGCTVLYELADESLSDRWKRQAGIFALPMAQHIMRGVLSGLTHMHHHGAMHRDLKPANVLLRASAHEPLQVFIADFGWGGVWDGSDAADRTPGAITWPYRAPEITLSSCYGLSGDVWSAGVLARELLTGVNLAEHQLYDGPLQHAMRLGGTISEETWPGCTACSGWDAAAAGTPLEPMDRRRVPWPVPPLAEAAVRHMLHLQPAGRPTAAMAFEHPWLRGPSGACRMPRLRDKQAPPATPWKQPRAFDLKRPPAQQPRGFHPKLGPRQLAGHAAARPEPKRTCLCKGNCRSPAAHIYQKQAKAENGNVYPCRYEPTPGRDYCLAPGVRAVARRQSRLLG